MNKLVINGGKQLLGTVEINGAKNAALAVIPAAVMANNGACNIDNVPDIEDVHCIGRILNSIGCDLKHEKNSITIDSSNLTNHRADSEDATKMRASYYLIGALLGRFKKAVVALPGGCPIGQRPIDQHIKGFKALGATVTIEDNILTAEAEKLVGTNIFFDVVSVGATINVMLAATLAEGTTILENAAREPHVVDVANFLNSMGAKIKGAGTDVIRIVGVKSLTGCYYSVIPDQIEAGTYMIAAAACGGEVKINNVIPKHLESISAKLIEMGAEVTEGDDYVIVKSNKRLKSANIKTLPYPGFPTDVQQPMSVLLCISKGQSTINESIFENRFKHLEELKKMGAIYTLEDSVASIQGVENLTGAVVKATDLRAGAAMVIAGLVAKGHTEIHDIEHIDRGYPNIEEKFAKLGADVVRV